MATIVILTEYQEQDYVWQPKTFILTGLKENLDANLGVSCILATLRAKIFKFYQLVINFELFFIPLFGKLN